jgi:sec-independent protein translocase protein TatA
MDCKDGNCAGKSKSVRRMYSRREVLVFDVTDAARGNTAVCDNTVCECAPGKSGARRKTMGDLLQPWHLIVLGVVAFLLFGAKRLPELGKGLGEGLKGFKEGIKGVSDPPPPPPPTVQHRVTPPPAPPAAAPAEPQIIRKD